MRNGGQEEGFWGERRKTGTGAAGNGGWGRVSKLGGAGEKWTVKCATHANRREEMRERTSLCGLQGGHIGGRCTSTVS